MYIFNLPSELQNRRFPLTMTIPPERATRPGLALPNGQWRRLADGGIEVVFNSREELAACIEATQEIRAAGG